MGKRRGERMERRKKRGGGGGMEGIVKGLTDHSKVTITSERQTTGTCIHTHNRIFKKNKKNTTNAKVCALYPTNFILH